MASFGTKSYEHFENYSTHGESGQPEGHQNNIALEEMSNFQAHCAPSEQQEPGNQQGRGDGVLQANLENLDNLVVAPPVVMQPQLFSADMLDPQSRSIHNQLATKHMSSTALLDTVQQAGNRLQSAVHGQFASLRGNMGYRDLLIGLMYEGEVLQTHNQFSHLTYSHLVYANESNVTECTKPGGIGLITNKRLLLLSSQRQMAMGLKEWGNAKSLPGGYTLNASCGDTTYYQPIPLRYLRSVEMEGHTGVSGTISIHGVQACCCGLCGICGGCLPDALKTWFLQPVLRSQTNEMVVTLGFLMPPWERKMFIHIHVDQNVPVAVVRDFVSLLQRNTPNLR